MANKLEREFRHNGSVIPDPDPNMQPNEVLKLFAMHKPELINSTIAGPEIVDDKAIYTLSNLVGSKG